MAQPAAKIDETPESPKYVRTSLAAAMTLGLAPGTFHRGARLGCINLLLTYRGGCKANCAFCGLAREKHATDFDPKFEKFIRVAWRPWSMEEIIARCAAAPPHVQRVCISQVTHPRSHADTIEICRAVRQGTGLPVSLLIAPTMMGREHLVELKAAGADRVGVAIDCATPELFERLRGKPAGGPHRWEHYWDIYRAAAEIFGRDMVGVHLIHGLGETEEQLARAMQQARDLGGGTHLFCFFPEKFSALKDLPQPPANGYRRVQLARWLIDRDLARAEDLDFDDQGRISRFRVDEAVLESAIASGDPFMTSGCPGADGRVACNRPYGNERPGPDLRNYPFQPEAEDLILIREQLVKY